MHVHVLSGCMFIVIRLVVFSRALLSPTFLLPPHSYVAKASSANNQPVAKGGVYPNNTAALPIPPPPPVGWSGVCKTMIDPANCTPKVSVLATADQVSKQIVIQKEDAETLKKKKEDKKARQRAEKTSKAQAAKSESNMMQEKTDEPEAVLEGKTDAPEAVLEGK